MRTRSESAAEAADCLGYACAAYGGPVTVLEQEYRLVLEVIADWTLYGVLADFLEEQGHDSRAQTLRSLYECEQGFPPPPWDYHKE